MYNAEDKIKWPRCDIKSIYKILGNVWHEYECESRNKKNSESEKLKKGNGRYDTRATYASLGLRFST